LYYNIDQERSQPDRSHLIDKWYFQNTW